MPERNSDWIAAFRALQIGEVYYLTSLVNLDSILTAGILPQEEVVKRGLLHEDISEPSVQRRRDAKGLHTVVPLYYARKTPMSYVRRDRNTDLCILVLTVAAVCQQAERLFFTDGNGASEDTHAYSDSEQLADNLPLEVIRAEFWHHWPEGRRRRCAELLVYPRVPASTIKQVEVFSPEGRTVGHAAIERARSAQPIDWTCRCVVKRDSFII